MSGKYFLFLIFFAKSYTKHAQPNIIFIVADDLGWGDVSFHGSNSVSTPNIDVMGFDGIILNNYYVAPLCTPSRGAIMTGKYPIRLGLQHRAIRAGENRGLPLSETTLPQHLKQLGYSTHGVGKWHLGSSTEQYLPTRRGFDTFFGHWHFAIDYFSHTHSAPLGNNLNYSRGFDLHNNENEEKGYNGEYITEVYTSKAKEIINNHNFQKNPLFLYLSHNAVHTGGDVMPLQIPYQYLNRFFHVKDNDKRVFAGMVASLDHSVGEIIQSIDKAGVLNNTIIIFTSDNGGDVSLFMGSGSNFPLRGCKNTLFEGGTRAVGWIWSPNLRKNKVLNELMHETDWLPTLYAAAGGNLKNLVDLDGYNQWPTLLGEKPSPRKEVLYNIDPMGYQAIRKNNYKLILGTDNDGYLDGWFNDEGKPYNKTEYFDDVQRCAKRDIYNENLMRTQSTAFKVLLKNYKESVTPKVITSRKPKDVILNCQLNIKNIEKVCKPEEAPCLFNIEEDPCEFNNLAQEFPQVVEDLQNRLNAYNKKSIPPSNKDYDESSNPKYYDYFYVPWMSSKYSLKYTQRIWEEFLPKIKQLRK